MPALVCIHAPDKIWPISLFSFLTSMDSRKYRSKSFSRVFFNCSFSFITSSFSFPILLSSCIKSFAFSTIFKSTTDLQSSFLKGVTVKTLFNSLNSSVRTLDSVIYFSNSFPRVFCRCSFSYTALTFSLIVSFSSSINIFICPIVGRSRNDLHSLVLRGACDKILRSSFTSSDRILDSFMCFSNSFRRVSSNCPFSCTAFSSIFIASSSFCTSSFAFSGAFNSVNNAFTSLCDKNTDAPDKISLILLTSSVATLYSFTDFSKSVSRDRFIRSFSSMATSFSLLASSRSLTRISAIVEIGKSAIDSLTSVRTQALDKILPK
mmetsp:Transcript_28838/g.65991  ORF Transcript_28838/g.65991 Transcript_28838/m.65991 type:complete len:320 (-) Transcript_28838:2268-3227(-)